MRANYWSRSCGLRGPGDEKSIRIHTHSGDVSQQMINSKFMAINFDCIKLKRSLQITIMRTNCRERVAVASRPFSRREFSVARSAFRAIDEAKAPLLVLVRAECGGVQRRVATSHSDGPQNGERSHRRSEIVSSFIAHCNQTLKPVDRPHTAARPPNTPAAARRSRAHTPRSFPFDTHTHTVPFHTYSLRPLVRINELNSDGMNHTFTQFIPFSHSRRAAGSLLSLPFSCQSTSRGANRSAARAKKPNKPNGPRRAEREFAVRDRSVSNRKCAQQLQKRPEPNREWKRLGN